MIIPTTIAIILLVLKFLHFASYLTWQCRTLCISSTATMANYQASIQKGEGGGGGVQSA